MASNTYTQSQISKQSQKIIRKQSFIKQVNQNKHFSLELPRFYSQDEKKKNKLFIKKQSQKIFQKDKNLKQLKQTQKQVKKMPKTQKTQTPPKSQQVSSKKIKFSKQKWQDLIKKSSSKNNSKLDTHQNAFYDQQITTNYQKKMTQPNKINYKAGIRKLSQGEKILNSKKLVQMIQTEVQINDRKPYKQQQSQKFLTQEATHFIARSRAAQGNSNIIQKKITEDAQFKLKQSHFRRNTSFQVAKSKKISKQQAQFIKTVHEIIRKTIRESSNLAHSESYIVMDKSKLQKKFWMHFDQQNKQLYKTHIILTRFTFYLCAHYILVNNNTKILLNILSKLLQNNSILMSFLGVEIVKEGGTKIYSHQKISSKQLAKRISQSPDIKIQNRGNTLSRNNNIVKTMLEELIRKKGFAFSQLFVSLLQSSSEIKSFDFISYLDKTLKWQVLKMPSYPFLPQKQEHQHQTLIHFDSNNEVFHIRPYAQEFVANLAYYYEITIFTAATKEYADQIINQLDKKGHIKHRLYRNHLTFLQGQSLKDISMLGRDLKKTIIVDNLWSNFRLHMHNGILIKSWFGGSDTVLRKLQTLLKKLIFQFPQDLTRGIISYKQFIDSQISQIYKGIKIKYDI